MLLMIDLLQLSEFPQIICVQTLSLNMDCNIIKRQGYFDVDSTALSWASPCFPVKGVSALVALTLYAT